MVIFQAPDDPPTTFGAMITDPFWAVIAAGGAAAEEEEEEEEEAGVAGFPAADAKIQMQRISIETCQQNRRWEKEQVSPRLMKHLRICSLTSLQGRWSSSSSEPQWWPSRPTLLRSCLLSDSRFALGMRSPEKMAELGCSHPRHRSRGTTWEFWSRLRAGLAESQGGAVGPTCLLTEQLEEKLVCLIFILL